MTLSITRAADRLDALSRMGCIVCRKAHGSFVQNDIQHLTTGGRRMGERFTIPLCPWHHRAVPAPGFPPAEMERIYGPSFAKSRERFELAYGHDVQLLEETDQWLGVAEKPKWYQELKAGWHHSHGSHNCIVSSSENSTPTESPLPAESSSSGSSTSLETSSPPLETKPPASSPVLSKSAALRKRTLKG